MVEVNIAIFLLMFNITKMFRSNIFTCSGVMPKDYEGMESLS